MEKKEKLALLLAPKFSCISFAKQLIVRLKLLISDRSRNLSAGGGFVLNALPGYAK